jgi:hypothetical protein
MCYLQCDCMLAQDMAYAWAGSVYLASVMLVWTDSGQPTSTWWMAISACRQNNNEVKAR